MEFDDVFTIRLPTARPTVVAATPESVAALLEADPATAHAGEARRTLDHAGPLPGRLQRLEFLRAEIRRGDPQRAPDTGVTITALMPGPTETEICARAGMADTKVGSGEKDDRAEVGRQGFEALMAGKEKVVAGSLKHKLQTAVAGVIPDSTKAEMHRKMAEPGSDG